MLMFMQELTAQIWYLRAVNSPPCMWHIWVAVFCGFYRVFSCVFPTLQMWVPADDNSPKLVEMISHKPYI